ncbi:aminoglycoside phosphotransferase family protein [Actinoplanes sp. L3-i22]|uniref:aminoglycoside phosphotransferase family protein n=1 Tax=Actinoplanes sp. L3-i22 TaxID=2836373 RepID=UPI001C757493|nr:aminoglycoside phosphotransferase family protein [Actinoplanes sp. L3-i22]BCY08600.1 hypothetical protein L3i22_036880 [Actinoplanes sp. L3-i22]
MTDPIRTVLGERAQHALSMWEKSTNRRVVPAGDPMSGLSGAALLPVRVHDRGRVQAAVLKFCPPEPDGPAREPGAHNRALHVSPPAFRDLHLVEIVYDPIVMADGGMLLFQGVANGSLTGHAGLRRHHDSAAIGPAVREIVRAALADWNAPAARSPLSTRPVSPGEFLSTVLGYRLRPGHRLTRWLDDQPEIARPRSLHLSLSRFQDPLVNPIALLRDVGSVARLRVPLTTGLCHGDLHIDNVIVPRDGSAPELFRFIDLTTFATDAPLARDPMHLLLSIVDLHLPKLDNAARHRLAVFLVDGTGGERLPATLVSAVENIRLGGADAYADGERGDDWQVEQLLALVGCALMFVPRAQPGDPEAAWWYFALAAQAATRYLADGPTLNPVTVHILKPAPIPAPPVSAPSPPPVPAVAKAATNGHRPLTRTERRDLAEAVLAVPYVSNGARLDRIIAELPARVRNALASDGNDSLHYRVVNLITVMDRSPAPDLWSTFIEAIELHNGPAPEVDTLAGLIHDLRS